MEEFVPSKLDKRLARLGNYQVGGVNIFSPNMITNLGLPVFYIGLVLYFQLTPCVYPLWLIGLAIAVFGGILDAIDGKTARALGREILNHPRDWACEFGYIFAHVWERGIGLVGKKHIGTGSGSRLHKFWLELTFPGGTGLGKALDPHWDKLKIIPTLILFAAKSFLSPWLVGAIIVPEIIGTLMRRPWPLLGKYAHGTRATPIGKHKVHVQWACVVSCIPFHQGWVSMSWGWIPNLLLIVAIIMAVASVRSRWGKKK